jgi:hypothetical protein
VSTTYIGSYHQTEPFPKFDRRGNGRKRPVADINCVCDLKLVKLHPPLAFLFFLAACGSSENVPILPAFSDVDRIEQLVSKNACVGHLSHWERRYQFLQDLKRGSATRGKVYPAIISFRLRRGDATYPIKPVRIILPVTGGFIGEIDDRPGYWAEGQFDTTSDKLTFNGCGYSEGG